MAAYDIPVDSRQMIYHYSNAQQIRAKQTQGSQQSDDRNAAVMHKQIH